MVDKPIDFKAARERIEDARVGAEIEEDQLKWEALNNHLFEMMEMAELSDHAITSACLRALLDILMLNEEVKLEDAKESISRTLNAYFVRMKK